MFSLPSVVETMTFRGRDIYVKRDDLIHPYLSGNKFRKLYTLYHTPASRYRKVVSYGGSQSNAMLSIAYVCHCKGWAFEYYTKPLNLHVKEEKSSSNFSLACSLGMQVIEVAHNRYEQRVRELFMNLDPSVLILPQGGATAVAQEGVAALANEICQWQSEKCIENLHVAIPSGTGTTAFFLAHALPYPCYTVSVAGSNEYLLEQMRALGEVPHNLHLITTQKKYHFAKPYREFLEIYHELLSCGIEFDLLYAPKMWLALSETMEQIEGEILYIHSGGVQGNGTMRQRYEYKGWR